MPFDEANPSSAFLINEYKLSYLLRRIPQTLLGGVKLNFTNETPWFIFAQQLFLLLYPVILGGLFTALFELHVLSTQIISSLLYASALLVVSMVISGLCYFAPLFTKYDKANKSSHDIVTDEDDHGRLTSCFGLETIEFLFAASKLKIYFILHPVLGAITCGVVFPYLLPSSLQAHYDNYAVTITLYIFGWLAACIAHYSVIAKPPPEPAVFRQTNFFGIDHLMRIFYVLLLCGIGLILRLELPSSAIQSVDPVLHAVLSFLPVCWLFGLLPPLDALLPWLSDQLLVHAFGASPAASDCRSAISLSLCAIHYGLVGLIGNATIGLIVSACSGCVLSLDIVSLVYCIGTTCARILPPFSTEYNLETDCKSMDKNKSSLQRPFHYLLKLTVVVFCTVVCGTLTGLAVTGRIHISTTAGGYVILGSVIIYQLLLLIQSTYIFGICRNPLFHRLTLGGSATDHSLRSIALGAIRTGFLRAVIPFLCVVVVSSSLDDISTIWSSWIHILAVVRFFRWVWLNPCGCALDIVVMHVISLMTHRVDWWIVERPVLIRLFVIAFCRVKGIELLQKLRVMLLLSYHGLATARQRHRAMVPSFVVSLLLLPAVLACVVFATVFSAPLLPVFTLPLFLIGFPRPWRFWPAPATEHRSANNDWVYYKHAIPALVHAFHSHNATGVFGHVAPGDVFLARFHDRILWITVAEAGFMYCNAIVKGLELQETSCHATEAARVDDIFEAAFSTGPSPRWNRYPLNALQPLDVMTIATYSDARNVLTGIIDQKDTRRKVSKMFLKTLTWLMLKHCRHLSCGNGVTGDMNGNSNARSRADSSTELAYMGNSASTGDPHKKLSTSTMFQAKASDKSVTSTADLIDNEIGADATPAGNDEPVMGYGMPATDQHSTKCVGIKTSLKYNVQQQAMRSVRINIGETPADGSDNDEFGDFGFSDDDAVDGGSPVRLRKASSLGREGIQRKQGRKISRARQSCVPSSLSKYVNVPVKWREIFAESLVNLVPMTVKFPLSWYKFVLESFELHCKDPSLTQNALLDQGVMSSFYQLIMWCYCAVELAPYTEEQTHSHEIEAGRILRCFQGDLPWSVHSDHIDKDMVVRQLVVKAYRYAFKVVYDECVLGEIDDFGELTAALTDIDNNWHLGLDTSAEWTRAVQDNKPHLLTIGSDPVQGTYTSRVLTLQELPVSIGALPSELIRSLWSSLALELVYFTSDDDERYSIQAHPAILRNITVQAADPPLGYPVYSSGLRTSFTW